MSRSLIGQLNRVFGPRLTSDQVNEAVTSRITLMEQEKDQANISIYPSKNVKVGIIGGGLAGLYSAYLMKDLYDISLYESSNDVGGRVRSVHSEDNRIVEQGAELVGLNHTRVLKLIADFGLGFNAIMDSDHYDVVGLECVARLNRKNVSGHELKMLYHELHEICQELSKRSAQITDPSKPWTSDNAEVLDQQTIGDFLAEFKFSSIALKALDSQFENNNGISADQQSYLGMLSAIAGAERGGRIGDYWKLTEFGRCSRGNQQIARSLWNQVQDFVHLNCPIGGIDFEGDLVKIFSANGELVNSVHYVILTAPPSVWTERLVDDEKMRFNSKNLMNKAVKFSARFDERFWLKSKTSPCILTDSIGLIWEPTENQLQAENQQVSMMVFAGGKFAEKAIQAPHRISHFSKGIRSILGSTPRIDKYNSDFFNWPEEGNSKCGYSCPGKGMVTTTIKDLNSIHKSRLLFAGEYTSPDFFGYMEGALRSSERVAQQIAKQLANNRLNNQEQELI